MSALITDPQTWVAFITLSLLEIVLGIDNIVFISILVARLPRAEQQLARITGLTLAMLTRTALLFSIVWLTRLVQPWFYLGGRPVSARDLILLLGGLFLIAKAVVEIHHTLEGAGAKEPGQPLHARLLPIVAQIAQSLRGQHVGVLAPLIIHRKGYYNELAKWAAARGHTHLRVDGQFVPTSPWARLDRFREHTIELPLGDLQVGPDSEPQLRHLVQRALELGHGVVQVLWPLEHLKTALQRQQSAQLEHRLFSIHRTCPSCGRAFPEPDPRLFSYNSKHGWCPDCFGTGLRLPGFGAEHSGEELGWNDWYEGEESPCPTCTGQRLNQVALAVRFDERSIAQVGAMTVVEAGGWLGGLALSGRQLAIACYIVA